MEFLSYVAGLTKRKGDLLKEAKRLSEEAKDIEGLEKLMEKKSVSLVSSIREGKINSSELFRAVADNTLVSSLAAIALGAKGSKEAQTMEDEFPTAVMRIQPLSQFYVDFLQFQQSDNFAQEDEEGDTLFGLDPDELAEEGDEVLSPPATWQGVLERVKRYTVTPIYGWFHRGEMRKNTRLGYKEMRRITRKDKKVCPDCVGFQEQGWKPIGALPSPGTDCRCYDRCRCAIEYR